MILILDNTLSEIEKDYYKHEMPKVRKAINEFKAEIGNEGRKLRLSFLQPQHNAIQSEIDGIYANYESLTKTDTSYLDKFIGTIGLEGLKKEFKKIKSEMRYLKGAMNRKVSNNNITPEMIERARQYPFENLIEVKKGKALCPFHDDKNPSMDVRNGFYYCYACGASGDIIAFVIKRDRLTFTDAVESLQ